VTHTNTAAQRAAFRAESSVWGGCTLYRERGSPDFEPDEAAFVGSVSGLLGAGLRRSLIATAVATGTVGSEGRPLHEGQLAVFGAGDALAVQAGARQDSRSPNLEVLILGGAPIREPVVFHGPFVMNTREEIYQAVQDFHAGRMGTIPATSLEA